MKNFESRLKRKGPVLFCFTLALCSFTFFSSCNDSKKPKDQQFVTNSISNVGCVLMTPAQVQQLTIPGEGEEAHMYSKLILRFTYTTDGTGAVTFALTGYKVRHHEEFGRQQALSPVVIKASPNCVPLRIEPSKQYIFGNNEIAVVHLQRLGKKQDGSYNYLLFTPKRGTDGQVYFTVTVASDKGISLTPSATNDDDTKPSPPARPEP